MGRPQISHGEINQYHFRFSPNKKLSCHNFDLQHNPDRLVCSGRCVASARTGQVHSKCTLMLLQHRIANFHDVSTFSYGEDKEYLILMT